MGGASVNLPDLSDVQGLAMYGYGKLTEASYLLLRIRDAEAARTWIASAPVSTAEYRDPPPTTALQIAFTPSGLHALGMPQRIIEGFSVEFIDGMAGDPNRSRRLGDVGRNDPADWRWGAPGGIVDMVVMLFAVKDLAQWQQTVQTAAWHQAFEIVRTLDTSNLEGREHFGFNDGISQPEFDWKREQPAVQDTTTYTNVMALGEILLGYPNEYGKYTDRPLLETADDPGDVLLPAEDNTARKDLARNGSFFVLRQLEQDVRAFWQYVTNAAEPGPDDPYQLAERMVGRTMTGEPLIPPTGEHIPGVKEQPDKPRNAFTYDHDLVPDAKGEPDKPRNAFTYDHDPAGTECPLGAHIRRANPRNADLFGHPADPVAKVFNSALGLPPPQLRDDLMASTRFHRILRRGREYGPKLAPRDALSPPQVGEPERGLHFGCVGANIARQFEFVQNAWLMSTKFNGLTEESDPLLGNRAAMGDCPVTGYFSIPRAGKVKRLLTRMPQFIRVRGGAYFFLPGIRALRYIARGGNPAR